MKPKPVSGPIEPIDPYAHKKKDGKSKARNILKKTGLRNAFLLKEILNRPYD